MAASSFWQKVPARFTISIEGGGEYGAGATRGSFSGVLAQIVLLDIVFSLDSVITAVGMVDQIGVMIVAVVVAVAVMMVFLE